MPALPSLRMCEGKAGTIRGEGIMQGLRGTRHSRRGWRALLPLVLLALFLTPSVALADKPTREPVPAAEPLRFAAGEVCAFPVLIEVPESKTKVLTFTDDSGTPLRQLITGKLRLRVTNLATGESLVVNVSGPGFLTFTEGNLATVILGGGGGCSSSALASTSRRRAFSCSPVRRCWASGRRAR